MPASLEELRYKSTVARLMLAEQEAREGNPMPFVRLQWGDDLVLDGFQIDAICSAFDPTIRTVACKGNTGCGKGVVAAITVCTFYSLWDDARVVLTRDSHKRAVSILWGECRKWWLRMKFPPRATVQVGGAVDPANRMHEVAVVNPGSDEGFQGVHSEHVLYVFDEATAAVLDSRFRLADTQATKFLALANPRTTAGSFRRLFPADKAQANITQTIRGPYGRTRCITIGGLDCMNVRKKCLDKPVCPPGGMEIDGHQYQQGETIRPEHFAKRRAIIPGQTCYDTWIGHTLHPDRQWVGIYAHGHFPDEDPDKQLIFSSWLDDPDDRKRPCALWRRWHRAYERAAKTMGGRSRRYVWELRERLERYLPVQSFGLDVAGSANGDSSVLTAGGRGGMRAQHRRQFSDTHVLIQWVLETIQGRYGIDLRRGEHPIGVDVDGIGKGAADMLRAAGALVLEIHGNGTSTVDPLKYANLRAECYGEFGARLDPSGQYKDQPFAVEDAPELREELAAPEKIPIGHDGLKFRITPKDPVQGQKGESLREKLGRSPDCGDSAVYWWRAQQLVTGSLQEWLDAGAW